MRRYKYLGRKVKDVPPRGLTHPSEVRKIALAVVRDVKKRRITKKTARGRLLLLIRLTKRQHNSKLRASRVTREKLREFIRTQMRKL